MKLLAIDAATEACSVALQVGDDILVRYEVAPRGHAQRILPMVDEVLAEASLALKSLDAIAFDCGPGSFTGVRVGTSVTQGLAFGADLPVIAVSSLAAIAQGVWQDRGEKQVLSVIDARMEEVYWGHYVLENGVMVLQGTEQVSKATDIEVEIHSDWFGAGTGFGSYQASILSRIAAHGNGIDADRLPHAKDLLPLASCRYEKQQFVSAEQALPSYLRNEVAHKQSGL